MMSDPIEPEEPTGQRGFSGLASLVSDVSSVVDQNPIHAPDSPAKAASRGGNVETAASDTSVPHADDDLTRAPASPTDTASSASSVTGRVDQDNRSASPQVLPWLIAFAAVAVALFVIFRPDQSGSVDTAQVSSPRQSSSPALPSGSIQPSEPAATPTPIQPSETIQRLYAVAALNANIRAAPSTRAKKTGMLTRGAAVEAIEHRDGFVRFRTSSGADGWISSDVLIEMAHLARLQASTPADYIAARERFTPIERLNQHLNRISPQVRALLSQIEGGQQDVSRTVSEIEGYQPPVMQVDSAAGLWYSFAARAAANTGNHSEAIGLAAAAIYADPLTVDYHTALGFSAISAGHRQALSAAAAVLPALAPRETNTWVVVGINAALEGQTALAHGALLTALDRSRNRATTIRVLRGIATRSKDTAVVAAVNKVAPEDNDSAARGSTSN